MRPVSVEQMRTADHRAIEEYGIPGIVLMENAGIRTVDFIEEWYAQCVFKKHIVLVCGSGNNGGDGFVIARHLINRGYAVRIFLAASPERVNGDARVNLDIIRAMGADLTVLGEAAECEDLERALREADFVIDALFGTGLDRVVKDPYARYIELINASGRPVLAVDCPSGLQCDTGGIWGCAVKATHTVTMGAPKIGFYERAGQAYTGEVHSVDISIPKKIMEDLYDGTI